MTTSCSAHIKTMTSCVEVFNGWCPQIQFSKVFLNLLAQSPLTTRFLFNWAMTRNCSDSKYINVKPIVFARDQSNSLGMNVLPYSLVFTRRSYQLKLKERFYRRGTWRSNITWHAFNKDAWTVFKCCGFDKETCCHNYGYLNEDYWK